MIFHDFPIYPLIFPCFPRSMVDLFISILHPIVPFCPSCSARKVRRPGGRRFIPFRGEVFQLVKPTSQAIHHLPNCSMESMKDYAHKEVPIRVYRFTTGPGVNSTCCSFFHQKRSPLVFLKIGYQASKIAASTPFSHRKSHIWGIPTWKSWKSTIFSMGWFSSFLPPWCHQFIMSWNNSDLSPVL